MIEIDLFEDEFGLVVSTEKLFPIGVSQYVRFSDRIGDRHDSFNRRELCFQILQHVVRTVNFAAVLIMGAGKDDFRFDLSEAVNDSFQTEIRGGAAPGRSETGGGQAGDDRFWHIGNISGHTVAFLNSCCA